MTASPADKKEVLPASFPLVVAVTGGIGCGKSEVGHILAEHGVDIWDADVAARFLVDTDPNIIRSLSTRFGSAILNSQGAIERSRLARVVFSNTEARRGLNEITHPRILEQCAAWRRNIRDQIRHGVALVPLLFESGLASRSEWDAVICVVDRKERILKRLTLRGLTREEAEQRIAAQWPLAEKERLSDFVLCNDEGLDALKTKTLALWENIVQKGRVHHA